MLSCIHKMAPQRMILLKAFMLLAAVGITGSAYGQREITPDDIKQITKRVENEAKAFEKHLRSLTDMDYHEVDIAFHVDTFRILRYMEESIDINGSTLGMREAGYEAAAKYDSLLNKYYRLLLKELQLEDKKKLQNAQRAWIKYKDTEMELFWTLREDQYSGGGTMQLLFGTSRYLEFVQSRANEMYQYYSDVIKTKALRD